MGCTGSRSKDSEDGPAGMSTAGELLQSFLNPDDVERPKRGEADGPRSTGKRRIYYLDWMRVVAIYLVVTYHVVQALDWIGFFNNDAGLRRFVVSFRATALQVGMPMFFHISGRAHALTTTVGFRKTLWRRTQRLLLPFAVCYVVLIPPWQYIDKEYDWEHPSSFRMRANPITWLYHYYTTSRFFLYFDFAWLWFLPALFVITLVNTPLILLAERYKEAKMRFTYSLATIGLWAGLMLGLVEGLDFSWSFGIFAVMGPASAVVIAQFAPLPPRGPQPAQGNNREWRSWCAVRLVTVAQVVASVGLVLSFGYTDIDPHRQDGGHDPRAAIPFLVLCTGFYSQGYFTQRWSQSCANLDGDGATAAVGYYRLFVAFGLQLVLFVSSPSAEVEDGHFIYPIYSASYEPGPEFGALYVLGTWCYIGIFVALFQSYGDGVISEWFHKHATGSTIVVYIFHWVFLKVFAFWIANPTLFRHDIKVHSVWTTMIWTFVSLLFAVACSLGVYWLLLAVPRLGRLFGL